MKCIKIDLEGKSYSLRATWGASMEIDEEVGDPMAIMRDVALTKMFSDKGLEYAPKIPITMRTSTLILLAGLRTDNPNMTVEDLGPMLMVYGPIHAAAKAIDFITSIVIPDAKVSDKVNKVVKTNKAETDTPKK